MIETLILTIIGFVVGIVVGFILVVCVIYGLVDRNKGE